MSTIAQDSSNVAKYLQVDSRNYLETSPEHSLKGKTILYNTGTVAGGNLTLRTVTAGKTFYLLSAWISYVSTVDNSFAKIYVATTASPLIDLRSSITATYHTSDSNSLIATYPHPIPIAAGVAIILSSQSASTDADGGIVGWEE